VTVNEADQDRTVIKVVSLLGLARQLCEHGRHLHVCVCDHGQFLQRVRGRGNIGIAFKQIIVFFHRGRQGMEFIIRFLLLLNPKVLNMMQFGEVC
jgi:hypothetical protein